MSLMKLNKVKKIYQQGKIELNYTAGRIYYYFWSFWFRENYSFKYDGLPGYTNRRGNLP